MNVIIEADGLMSYRCLHCGNRLEKTDEGILHPTHGVFGERISCKHSGQLFRADHIITLNRITALPSNEHHVTVKFDVSNEHEHERERGCDNKVADAINAMAAEIRCARESSMVTRCDLNAAEARLTAIIQGGWVLSPEDQAILDALIVRSGRVARKLEALDGKTPAR